MRNTKKMLMLAVLGICAGAVCAEPAADPRGTLVRQSLSAQHMEGQAEALVREGNKLFLEDKYQDAIARYIDAKQLFERFKTGEFAKRVKSCDDQIRKCYYLLAEEAYKAAEKSASEKDFEPVKNRPVDVFANEVSILKIDLVPKPEKLYGGGTNG